MLVTKHPLFRSWTTIKDQLTRPSHRFYSLYQQLGLTCDWDNSRDFCLDIEHHLGLPLPGEQLVRKDYYLGWTLSNLAYMTPKQKADHLRSCRMIKYRGKTKNLTEWAEAQGIAMGTVWSRINVYGWTPAEALGFKARKRPRATHAR